MTAAEAEGRGSDETARRKFYGRRHGKRLKPLAQALIETRLPLLRVPGAAREGEPGRGPVDPAALYPDGRPLWLEIGFGGGEHLAHQAAIHPAVGFIGCEPFINGVGSLLTRLEAAGLGNVRVHPGDARDLLELLPAASLARVFLLYPDPWPKTRHRERRFMNAENLGLLARAMAPGAVLRLATDIPAYGAHALAAVAASPDFAVAPGEGAPWARPWADWPGTRYEAKALREGRRPHYLTFVRG